jgi:hypothetical protein
MRYFLVKMDFLKMAISVGAAAMAIEKMLSDKVTE